MQQVEAEQRFFKQIARDVRRILDFDACLVWRLDRQTSAFSVVAVAGDRSPDAAYVENVRLHLADVPVQKYLREGRPILLRDVTKKKWARFYRHHEEARRHGWVSLITAPMICEGRVIGLIDSYKKERLTLKDNPNRDLILRFIQSLANQAAAAVGEHEVRQQFKALQQFSNRLASHPGDESIIPEILQEGVRLLGGNAGFIEPREGEDLPPRELVGDARPELFANVISEVIESGQPAHLANVTDRIASTKDDGPRSFLCVPLKRGERAVGALSVTSPFAGVFDDSDQEVLSALSTQVVIAINRAQLTQHLQEVAARALTADYEELGAYVVQALETLTGEEVLLWEASTLEKERRRYLRVKLGPEDERFDGTGRAARALRRIDSPRIPISKGSSKTADALIEGTPVVVPKLSNPKLRSDVVYGEALFDEGIESLMIVPLAASSKVVVGTLCLYSSKQDAFDKPRAEMVSTFASQVVTSIRLQRQSSVFRELATIGENLTKKLSAKPENLLDEVAKGACGLLDCSFALVVLYDTEEEKIAARTGFGGCRLKSDVDLWDLRRTKTIVPHLAPIDILHASDLSDADTFSASPRIARRSVKEIQTALLSTRLCGREEMRAFAAAPLHVGNGGAPDKEELPVGFLLVGYREPFALAEDSLQTLTLFAHQAAGAIGSAQLYQSKRKQAAELEELAAITLRLSEPEELKELLEAIVFAARKMLGGSGGKLYLKEGDRLVLRAMQGIEIENWDIGDSLALNQGLAGRVYRSGRPRIVNDYSKWSGRVEQLKDAFSAVIEVPLSKGGEVIGVLGVSADSKTHKFRKGDIPVLERLAQQATLAILKTDLLEQSRRQLRLVEALQSAAIQIVREREPKRLLEQIIEEAAGLMGQDEAEGIGAAYWECDYKAGKARVLASRNTRFRGREIDLDTGLIQTVLATGEGQIRNGYWQWEGRSEKFQEDELDLMRNLVEVPLKSGGRVTGVLAITDATGDRPFQPKDLEVLETFARIAAIAESTARMLDRERELARQAAILTDFHHAVGSSLELGQAANGILEGLHELVAYTKGSIQLLRGRRRLLVGARGFRREERNKNLLRPVDEDPLIRELVDQRKAIVLHDTHQAENWGVSDSTRDIRSWVGLPLISEETDEVVGLITLDHTEAGFFDADIPDQLKSHCKEAVVALERARAHEVAEQRIRDLEIVSDMARVLNREVDIQILSRMMLDEIVDKLNCSHCTYFSVADSDEGEQLVATAASGGEEKTLGRTFSKGEGIAGWVWETGTPELIPDATNHDRFADARRRRGMPRSMIVVPVISGGTTIGVIAADKDAEGYFGDDDLQLLKALAQHAAIAIERSTATDLLHQMSQETFASSEVEDVLQNLLIGATLLTKAPAGAICLAEGKKGPALDWYSLTVESETEGREPAAEELQITQEVLSTNSSLYIPDLADLTDLGFPLDTTSERLSGSLLAVPVMREATAIGVLILYDEPGRTYSEGEKAFLQTLTSFASIALRDIDHIEGELRGKMAKAELAERQREVRQQLAEAFESFTHQLQTPSLQLHRRVAGLTRQYADSEDAPERLQSDLPLLRGLASNVLQITHSLDLFARLSRYPSIPAPKQLLSSDDLVALLRQAAEDQDAITDPDIFLEFIVDAESFEALTDIPIWLNEDLLVHAVRNLLDNAMKYSFSNTEVRIAAELDSSRPAFLISVANTGIPLNEEDAEMCMERDWRGSEAEAVTADGSGIGLWLVQQIMDAHHGELRVTPTDPHDVTVFGLWFPAGETR